MWYHTGLNISPSSHSGPGFSNSSNPASRPGLPAAPYRYQIGRSHEPAGSSIRRIRRDRTTHALKRTMHTSLFHPRDWGVGAKITAFTLALIGAILAVLIVLINMSTSAMLEERAEANVSSALGGVTNTLDTFNHAMMNDAASFAHLFAAEFDGPFTLDAASPVDVAGKPAGCVALLIRRRNFPGKELGCLKLDGLVLPAHKIGRRTTSHRRDRS